MGQPKHPSTGFFWATFWRSFEFEGRWIDEWEYGSHLIFVWGSDPDDRSWLWVELLNDFTEQEFADYLRRLLAPCT